MMMPLGEMWVQPPPRVRSPALFNAHIDSFPLLHLLLLRPHPPRSPRFPRTNATGKCDELCARIVRIYLASLGRKNATGKCDELCARIVRIYLCHVVGPDKVKCRACVSGVLRCSVHFSSDEMQGAKCAYFSRGVAKVESYEKRLIFHWFL